MSSRSWRQNHWPAIITLCLMILGLIVYPTSSLYAQDGENGAASLKSPASAVDDATFLWQNSTTPYVQKPGASVPQAVEEPKQFANSLYLPGMLNEGQAAPRGFPAGVNAPRWRTIYTQSFDAGFPPLTPGWHTYDYNGGSVGGNWQWDDVSGGYNSPGAAHPIETNNPSSQSTYVDNAHAVLQYGPFSLVGALDAKFTFVYWLNSEEQYDIFSWKVSCNGVKNWTNGEERSGQINQWVGVNASLGGCIGKSNVYIKFTFMSDVSSYPAGVSRGVWVDNVRIQTYQ